jgi:hypothetical protein
MFLCFILSTGAAVSAQTSNGEVGGVVQDPSRALIPGVTVTLTNTETGVTATQVTNETGTYNFASVPPGTYRVSAALPGFKTSITNGVQVGTTAQVRLNLTLEVGTVDSAVEVSVTAAEVMTESSASVGDHLTEQRVVDLPLVGNNVVDMVKILPGYRAFPQFDSPGAAVYDVFAGQTSDTVNITRDGLSITDGRNDPRVFGLSTTTNINPEMIGEVRLILAPVDVEFGRGNTQIQILTKGGTNKFTGSAVWNVQNTALNANTWANNKNLVTDPATGKTKWSPIALDWRNTHDVTLTYGGPIQKNKTFFFAAWDQQLSNTRTLQTPVVLTDTARQGIFRYWEKWNPGNAASALPTYPATASSATAPAVDYGGNPLRPALNPDGTSYNGVLRCFSVFGNVKADGSAFTPLDCPGGTASFNGSSPWDPFRTATDSSGYIAKILTAMPRANYFGAGDGLNTAGFQWVRGTQGQGGANAAAGVSPFVNRKQINIRIDHNYGSKHRTSGSWSYQRDDSADFVASWPGGLNGATQRRPHVLTVTATSTLSPTMVNEGRFGLRYSVASRSIALESGNPSVRNAAAQWYLKGNSSPNGSPYLTLFTPAFPSGGVGDGMIATFSNTANNNPQDSGDITPLYNYADTFSWSHGKHAFKVGADLRLTRSNGYNSSGGNVSPALIGGAPTGLDSALVSTGNFTTQLPGFLGTAPTGGTAARANAANLLYFLNASIANASQLYWIDNASDVKNGTWQDIATHGRKYRNQVQNELSLFLKDDWKVTQRLTLNLGLRWDYYGSPYIGSGFTSASVGLGSGLFGVGKPSTRGLFDTWLRPGNTYLTGYGSSVTGTNALACANGVSQSPFLPMSTCDPNMLTQIQFIGPNSPNPGKVVIPNDYKNFGPAIGFAWQVPWFGKEKTVVRGGYQITYGGAGRSGSTLDTLLGSAPGVANSATTQVTDPAIAPILANRSLNLTDVVKLVPVTPLNAPGATASIYGRSVAFSAYDPNFTTPYIQNATMQITRSLTQNQTLDIKYIGTFGRKIQDSQNLNVPMVFDNPELFEALKITRAGGDAPLFDQMFAGLNFNSGVPGYAAVGTVGSTGVLQHGSAHLRRNTAFTANLANGDFVGVISSLMNLSTGVAGLQNLPTGVTGVNARVLRNGCDRIANGLYNPTLASNATTNIPTGCFPEDYFQTNPQFSTATFYGNLTTNNYHSMQIQHTLRSTAGTSLQTTYTWSKLMTDHYNNWVDPRHRQADYSMDYAGVPTELRMNGTFELPVGPNQLLLSKSSGWFARLVEKWQTSIVYNWGSGQPRDTFETAKKLYQGGGGNQPQARPDIIGPWANPKTEFKQNGPNHDTGTIYGYPSPYVTFVDPQCNNLVGAADGMGFSLRDNCTLNALARAANAGTPGAVALTQLPDGTTQYGVPVLQNSLPGTQGNQGARMLRLPARWFFDAAIFKTFRLSETKSLQFRIDANNILNHPNPGEPNFNVGSADFGRVTATKVSLPTSPRAFQAKLRLSF